MQGTELDCLDTKVNKYWFMDDPKDTLLQPSTSWTAFICPSKLLKWKSEIWNYFSQGKECMIGPTFLVSAYLKNCIILTEETKIQSSGINE